MALPVRLPGTPIRPNEPNRFVDNDESGCQAPPGYAPSRGALGTWARLNSVNRSERAHTVPGTVEIGSEHEVDTSAAVPGTDMLPD